MGDQSFSFRWGIPLLDKGDTRIPNFFFDHYTAAGISRTEFLTVLHLARYQFESAGSECRPSVRTVAQQMGYTRRGLQNILARLEKRGLLKRYYRNGLTTIYDFSGLSKAILLLNLRQRGEPQFIGGGEPQFMGGVNPSSPEEEQEEEQGRSGGGGDQSQADKAFLALTFLAVSTTVAHKLAKERDPAQILAWVEYTKNANGLRDPAAFIARRLLDDEPAPTRSNTNGNTKNRIHTAICYMCSRVLHANQLCTTCSFCPDCCTCPEKAEEP